jgi:E3 ubiquitin-protein ligase RBBP6
MCAALTSVIHYKFKNAAKKWDTITFDGPVIAVSELKKIITTTKKLGKSDDFDLLITNAQTGEGWHWRHRCVQCLEAC